MSVWCHDWLHLIHAVSRIYMIFQATSIGFLFSVCFKGFPGFRLDVWPNPSQLSDHTLGGFTYPAAGWFWVKGGLAAAGCCCGVVVAGAMFPFLGNHTCKRWSTWSLLCVPMFVSVLGTYSYSMKQLQEKPSLQVHGVKEGNEGEGSSWWSWRCCFRMGVFPTQDANACEKGLWNIFRWPWSPK